MLSLVCTDRGTEAQELRVAGPRSQNELLTTLETEDLIYAHTRYSMGGVGQAALMLFPSRWFSPILWDLASRGEKVVQVPPPEVPSLSAQASSRLTCYCPK